MRMKTRLRPPAVVFAGRVKSIKVRTVLIYFRICMKVSAAWWTDSGAKTKTPDRLNSGTVRNNQAILFGLKMFLLSISPGDESNRVSKRLTRYSNVRELPETNAETIAFVTFGGGVGC